MQLDNASICCFKSFAEHMQAGPTDGHDSPTGPPPLATPRVGPVWLPPPPRNDAYVPKVDSRESVLRLVQLLDSRYEAYAGRPLGKPAPMWDLRRPPPPAEPDPIDIRLADSADPLGDLICAVENSSIAVDRQQGIDLGRLRTALPELRALHRMVGLKTLKKDIVDQIAYYAQDFHKVGSGDGTDYLHTVIYGPPGTGKTEVAKLLGGTFCKLGALQGTGFYKACRSDLVAGYVGQTAIKTRAVIDAALGGVLFIDEAYALGHTDKVDSFAKECIDTLCEALSVHRNNLMVVIAGYEEELESCFFSYNAGLKSRFVWRYGTDKYTPSELGRMFRGKVQEGSWGLKIEEEALDAWFEKHGKSFEGYGRDVDALVTKAKIAHARRMFGSGDASAQLTEADLDSGLKLFARNKGKDASRPPPMSMYT